MPVAGPPVSRSLTVYQEPWRPNANLSISMPSSRVRPIKRLRELPGRHGPDRGNWPACPVTFTQRQTFEPTVPPVIDGLRWPVESDLAQVHQRPGGVVAEALAEIPAVVVGTARSDEIARVELVIARRGKGHGVGSRPSRDVGRSRRRIGVVETSWLRTWCRWHRCRSIMVVPRMAAGSSAFDDDGFGLREARYWNRRE